MRAWPFGLLFAHDPDLAIEWAVEQSRLTHRAPIAFAACAAFAHGIALAASGTAPTTVAEVITHTAARWSTETAEMMHRAADDAARSVPPAITLGRLRGWAAHEAIAAALYVFLRHPDDPRSAILEGANTPGDSDSIASMAGALVGARCGLSALPQDWVRDVERSDELIALSNVIVAIAGLADSRATDQQVLADL